MTERSLSHGIGTVLTGQLARLAVGTLSVLVIAALSGPEAKGALAVLVGVSTIASTLLTLGMNGAGTYFVSSKKWSVREGVAVMAAAVVWSAAGAYVISLLLITAGISQLAGYGALVLAAACGTQTFNAVCGGLLLGVKDFRTYAVTTVAVPLITLVAFFALRWTGSTPASAAIESWIAGNAFACVPGVWALLRIGGLALAWPGNFLEGLVYGMKASLATAMNVLNLRLDVVLLGLLAGAVSTGYYAIGVQFSEFIWIVPTAIGYVVLPHVAASHNDDGERTAMLSRSAIALGAAMGVASLVAAALYAAIVPVYWPSVAAVAILLPGTVAFTIAKVLGNDLFGRGMPQAHVWAALASVCVTVVGDLLLIPRFGYLAAAGVSSVAYALYALVILAWFRRATGVRLRSTLLVAPSDVRRAIQAAKAFLPSPRPVASAPFDGTDFRA